MTKSKSAQMEDETLAREIARATRFSACIHLGPNNRHTRYIEQGGREGYEAALVEAKALDGMSQFGRRSVVYAINNLGSFPVSADLARLAGLVG